jgi:hypothetical protein
MALDLALPGSLDALLDALVSPDNGVRSAAERAYEATTAASPDALLAALLAALRRSPVQERRELAAVLLRKARSLSCRRVRTCLTADSLPALAPCSGAQPAVAARIAAHAGATQLCHHVTVDVRLTRSVRSRNRRT